MSQEGAYGLFILTLCLTASPTVKMRLEIKR